MHQPRRRDRPTGGAGGRDVHPTQSASELEKSLWSGFSQPALRELEWLRLRSPAPDERRRAAYALANWHFCRGTYQVAVKMVRLARSFDRLPARSIWPHILESEALIALGRTDEARQVLGRELDRGVADADLCLAYANCFAHDPTQDATRLGWINRALASGGFAVLARADPYAPLSLDNLSVPGTSGLKIADAPKVSVIMTVHNAAATVRLAINSVLSQTWPNLELIVVDDASSDDTWSIVDAVAGSHPRVTAIRQEVNQGAYVARNLAANRATGDVITTHDSDDWSHPQKIETQWRDMTSRPGVVGSRSFWARTDRNLRFGVEWQPRERLITLNPSSFMFQRTVLTRLGGWDRVRASGDGEFIARADAAFGAGAFVMTRHRVPLSFGIRSDTSLSGHSETHFDTLHFELRRDYLDAARWWRNTHPPFIDPQATSRPFPAPRRLLPDRPPHPAYDLLFVDDFNRDSGTRKSTMDLITGGIDAGRRIAIFHWREFARPGVRHAVDATIWALAAANKIDVLSHGDRVVADIVIVPFAGILRFPIDNTPIVEAQQVFVVADEPDRKQTDRDDVDRETASAVLVASLGIPGTWVQGLAAVHAAIEAGGASARRPEG